VLDVFVPEIGRSMNITLNWHDMPTRRAPFHSREHLKAKLAEMKALPAVPAGK
jgi:hypothetical protein